MQIFDFINIAGGVALFLYGMNIMGSGLEKLAGSKMESILQRLTSSVPRAVLLGTVITALIQSSSGTTVICIGLVNSGIFTLSQAIGVIMGANIGTTLTGQLISLSDINGSGFFLTLLKPSTFSPIIALIGSILYVFCKSGKKRNIGQICMGFGILFTGMFTMERAVEPLRESPVFVKMFTSLQNPVLGLLAGTLVTVVLQSSSASVGILQALSSTGIVTWSTAVPIILGQNIGTCSTPLLASVGASTTAKRSAVVHFYFNVIGTGVFLAAIYGMKALGLFPFWNEVMDRGDIANFHTIFNVAVTLCFIPFTNVLAWLAEHTIPEKEGHKGSHRMPVLDQRLIQSPALAIQQAMNAVREMADCAASNLAGVGELFGSYDENSVDAIREGEDMIDQMEVSIGRYLVQISGQEISQRENRAITDMLKIIGDYERIGDYTVSLMEYARQIHQDRIEFSDEGIREAGLLFHAVSDAQRLTNLAMSNFSTEIASRAEPMCEIVDQMCEEVRENHIRRLKDAQCRLESGITYLNVINMLERIANHCSSIAAYVAVSGTKVDPHSHKQKLLSGENESYNAILREYVSEYLLPLRKIAAEES